MSGQRLLELACAFRELDLVTYPCSVDVTDSKNEKKPLIAGYHRDMPLFISELEGLDWAACDYLAMTVPRGHVVLDVDVDGGKRGREHLEAAQKAYGPLPSDGLKQDTLRGGQHLLFRTDFRGPFRASLYVPGVGVADINLVHPGNRFVVLYEPERWLNEFWWDLPVLASSWDRGMRHASSRRRSPKAVMVNSAVGPQALIVAVAEAEKGERNSTLSRVAYVLGLRGEATRDVVHRIHSAASSCELEEPEISRTIEKALTRAEVKTRVVDEWLRGVEGWAATHRVGLASRLRHTAHHLATRANGRQGLTVGMSSRELGELLGVHHKTASGYLRRFSDAGWIELIVHGTGMSATQYRLSRSELVPKCGIRSSSFRLADYGTAERLRRELGTHTAFQRLGNGPTLTRSALEVLVYLSEHGPARRQVLVTDLMTSKSTIHRAVMQLNSAGLVDVTHDGQIVLLGPDLKASLDHWVEVMEIPDRVQQRRERHESQRTWWASAFESRRRAARRPSGGSAEARRGRWGSDST